MTGHQLHGRIGENMAGTDTYDVCIVFTVYAEDGDAALDVVRDGLPRSTYPMEWAWIYTTKTN